METCWLLLPPFVRALTDWDGVLPLNVSQPILKRLQDDREKTMKACETAKAIWDHLLSGRPGWGKWPTDINEALAIGLFLGIEISRQAESLVLDMPEEDLAFVDDRCRERGMCMEQYLIEQIIAAKDQEGHCP